jgi:predicted naringenin-chalcone synthase
MGWTLGDRGMLMTLAREVPEIIVGALKDFLKGLFASAGLRPEEALGRGLFAVHPGGPRIIDQVAAHLELSPEQVAASRAVLYDCGNMSSATLPHIWARIAADDSVHAGTLVASLAFGPGLTVYGAMLRKA